MDCICCPSPFHTRQAVRSKNSLEANKIMDCVALCCCGTCAIHQDAKESGAPVIPPNGAFTRL
eukprot:gene1369-4543_t